MVNTTRRWVVNTTRLCLVNITRLYLVNTRRLCLVKYRPVNATRYLLIEFVPTIIICALLLFICPLTSSLYYPHDKVVIASRYNQMYLAMKQGDYETAYNCCMSPVYHQTHSFEEFKDNHWFSTDRLYTLHPEYSIQFSGDTATLYPNHYDFLTFM